MEGVVVHMLIGLVLFTPIGFLAGLYQERRAKELEEERKQREERING